MKSKDFFNYLKIMRQDNAKTRPPFRASRHWFEVNDLFNKELKNAAFTNKGIIGFRESLFNRKFGGLAIGNRKVFEMFLFMYYNKLKEKDKFGIIEKMSEPDNTLKEVLRLGKQKISVDLLFTADNILTIAEIYPEVLSKEAIVAELGSGWGCNGYLLRKINPKIRYLLFDLPEALALAQAYLPGLTKVKKIEYYKSDLGKVAKSKLLNNNIRFFGAQQLENVEDKSINLFINVASFQEMPREYIKAYFNLINKKVNGYFYTKNYINWFNPQDNAHLSVKDYPWLPNWKKKILRQSDNFHNMFVAIFKI